MRFYVDVRSKQAVDAKASPLAAIAEQLESDNMEYRPVGSTLELRAEWDKAMTALKRSFETVEHQFPEVSVVVTIESDLADANRHADQAERESFPASDPPGANPGST
ncbi:MAG: hypothetical protein ACLFP4_14675 [Spirochaetales bacterium]